MMNHIRHKWRKFLSRRRCVRYFGPETRSLDIWIDGPMIVHVSGICQVGRACCFKSRPYRRIDLSVTPQGRLILGENVFLNQGVRIAATQSIEIGRDVQIGDETVILDNDYHGVGGADSKSAPIIIGDGVWLATRVIVLKGVTIGKGCVVGAGAVVTKSIPPYSFAAGVPAQVVRSLEQPAQPTVGDAQEQ